MVSKKPAKPRYRPEPVWATAEWFCTRYQVSRSTWWRVAKIAGFPAPVRFARAVRWKVEDVEKYLTRNKAKSGIRKS
ncbi:AlpA family transcriptional regulator [Pseudomonas sp. FFUP_PS_473]|uniref:helix-turn-helix transcriptional regulator n=1 Tax=Pseudomonas sp. FFUP_PS_473 TaxID=2060418 RepID=UPI0011AE519C|nr:hypothetical protein [Pseudomonas sp. FFUP_PS_473]